MAFLNNNKLNIDISIIIINFNSYELTSQTLNSLAEFSLGFSYEIIIVDNFSEDGSGLKLKNDFSDYQFILNKENLGFAKANNQALKIANGNYILFLNNDVIFKENAIKSLLEYLGKENDKILIAPRLLNADGSVQHSIYSFQTLWLSFTTYFFLYKLFPKSKYFNRYYLMNKGVEEITNVETVTGAFMLFKKENILELNGFDEDYFFYGEDNDLCKRFRDSGGRIIYYPKVEITHLKGATKKTNWFHVKHHTLSVINLFRKHYSLPKRIIARILFFIGIILRSILLIASYSYTLNRKHLEDFKLKIKALPIIIKGKA